ncbi:putative RING-H2 finger protein [Dirofilaria immitis]
MLTTIIDIFFLLIIANVSYTSHIRKAHSYLDLYIKFSPIDDRIICENDPPCSIPYALSVLHSPNHFDLQSIMMQDGGLLRYSHNRYSDSTVIRLTKAMKLHNNGKIYLGLRFFDLPIDMQDYVIMDVMMVIENGIKGKLEMITENYRLHIRMTKELETNYDLSSLDYINNNTSNITNCECIRRNCACCMMLNVAKIDLNTFGCVNITYIAEDIGIRLSFSINGHVFISRELSLVNPPPYCLSLPFLKEYAGICLRLRNLRFRQTTLDGCMELEAELYHIHVATIHLGCFSIPI